MGLAGLMLLFAGTIGGVSAGAPPGRGGVTHEAGSPPPVRAGSVSPNDGRVTGQIVIGSDDRIRVVDTSIYPWRAIAFLELYDAFDQYVGSCTGTFIGPDAILTAAHCLYSADDGWIESIAVVPGKDGDFEPYGFEWAANWWVPDMWIDSNGDSLWDWGVIKMPSWDMGLTVGWFSVGLLTTETLGQPDIMPAIFGFPGDADPPDTMWGFAAEAFVDVSDFDLYYDIDTAAGQSGSAIFLLHDDFLGLIVGIHTTGLSEGGQGVMNRGSRIDQELLDDILLGCSEMDCEIDYLVEEPAAQPTATATATPTATPTVTPTVIPDEDRPFRVVAPLLSREG
ncbi:MAG: hypothetical protein Kow0010_13700 [Dehalococcoidia bacterium]